MDEPKRCDAGKGRSCSLAPAQVDAVCAAPPLPKLPPAPAGPFALDFGHDLGAGSGDDEPGRVEHAGRLAFGYVGLFLDGRPSEGPDDERAVDDVLFVAGAVGWAAPRCLWGKVEHAEAGHFTGRVSPALEVAAVFAHGHPTSLACHTGGAASRLPAPTCLR